MNWNPSTILSQLYRIGNLISLANMMNVTIWAAVVLFIGTRQIGSYLELGFAVHPVSLNM